MSIHTQDFPFWHKLFPNKKTMCSTCVFIWSRKQTGNGFTFFTVVATLSAIPVILKWKKQTLLLSVPSICLDVFSQHLFIFLPSVRLPQQGLSLPGSGNVWPMLSLESVESTETQEHGVQCQQDVPSSLLGYKAKMEAIRCRSVSKISSKRTCERVQRQAWLCPDTVVSDEGSSVIQSSSKEGLIYLMQESISVISFSSCIHTDPLNPAGCLTASYMMCALRRGVTN